MYSAATRERKVWPPGEERRPWTVGPMRLCDDGAGPAAACGALQPKRPGGPACPLEAALERAMTSAGEPAEKA